MPIKKYYAGNPYYSLFNQVPILCMNWGRDYLFAGFSRGLDCVNRRGQEKGSAYWKIPNLTGETTSILVNNNIDHLWIATHGDQIHKFGLNSKRTAGSYFAKFRGSRIENLHEGDDFGLIGASGGCCFQIFDSKANVIEVFEPKDSNKQPEDIFNGGILSGTHYFVILYDRIEIRAIGQRTADVTLNLQISTNNRLAQEKLRLTTVSKPKHPKKPWHIGLTTVTTFKDSFSTKLMLYSLENRIQQMASRVLPFSVQAISVTPDGKTIFGSGDVYGTQLTFALSPSGMYLEETEHFKGIPGDTSALFSPENRLFVATNFGEIYEFDRTTY